MGGAAAMKLLPNGDVDIVEVLCAIWLRFRLIR